MIVKSSPRDAKGIIPDVAFQECNAIFVGTGGTLTVTMASGNIATFTNVPTGGWFPIEAIQVIGSLSTASNLLAGYF